ncbi:MAG: HD-GYP domain-containing protein [Candidatus Binatia bacterium]
MNKTFTSFALLVVGGALLGSLSLSFTDLASLAARDVAGLAVLLLLAVVAEGVSIRYSIGGRPAASSIAFIPLFTIATLFPATAAVLSTAATLFIGEFAFRRRTGLVAIFNISQTVLSFFLALKAYGAVATVTSGISGFILPFAILAVVFFVSNIVIVSLAISLQNGQPIRNALSSLTGSGTSDIVYDLLVSPIALLVTVIYQEIWITGVLIVVLPLFIIRHSYFARLQLQQANTALLKVLIKAIETRDPYTSGHSVRVSLLARAIAADLLLRSSQQSDVETAALLHDIGKVDGVYADLIKKPSSLTEDEVQIIRTHATRGADFLRSLEIFGEDMIAGIRHHHERYDGRGYPSQLSAADIPLVARIIQISDSVDAMLSDRPYRRALTLEEVYSELDRCAGTQFDPAIIQVVLSSHTIDRVFSTWQRHAPHPRAESRIQESPV